MAAIEITGVSKSGLNGSEKELSIKNQCFRSELRKCDSKSCERRNQLRCEGNRPSQHYNPDMTSSPVTLINLVFTVTVRMTCSLGWYWGCWWVCGVCVSVTASTVTLTTYKAEHPVWLSLTCLSSRGLVWIHGNYLLPKISLHDVFQEQK